MWVYRSGEHDDKSHPVVIYDFQNTRETDHPEQFLKDYSGVLVTDGYQVCHSLEKKRDDLQVASCWIHAKRSFAEYVKATGTEGMDGTFAAQAVNLISGIFHLDHQCGDCLVKQHKKHRQLVVRPKVDAFFAWVKDTMPKVSAGSNTYGSLQYCINQEKFPRVFLSNGAVPMDNNVAERAILVETAKANHLRVYEYLEYLLDELSRHADDKDREFIKDLLPWSEAPREKCRNPKKS